MKKYFFIISLFLIFFQFFCKNTNNVKIPELVFIKGSHFKLGDNSDPTAFNYPQHYIYVKDFYISKFEITNRLYKFFIDENPEWKKSNINELIKRNLVDVDYLTHWEGDSYPLSLENHPVVFISYFAAVSYCKWLSKITGDKYRLPSEAEWEYAASNGDKKTPFSVFPFEKQNFTYADNMGPNESTRSVGSHKANNFGLYDMSGNVWELTMSILKPYPYNSLLSDSMNIKKYDEKIVIRGGSYQSFLFYLQTSYRAFINAKNTSEEVGFRVVKDI